MNTKTDFTIGKGFGSLIDLKFPVFLGDSEMQYIPVIHNGYVNTFFKTGALGLLLYFFYLFRLYLFTYSQSLSKKSKVIHNLIAGFALYFLFSSLIINGVYNIEETFSFMLGGFFFYKKSEF